MTETMHHPLIIYGCGGHARSVADVALHNAKSTILFVDPNAKPDEKSLTLDVLPSLPDHYPFDVIVGIGDNNKRALAFDMLRKLNINIITLLSKDAYIGKEVKLEEGIFVARAVHIGPKAHISANTLLNTHAIIEHDVTIGRHCHISVNATVAGFSYLDDYVMVGAGATIIDKIQVCANVVIGAGAVVTENITEPGTYVGVPARKVR